ncbi:hypothetical protein MMC21_004191 [Puttea exsequens]|nr:hypothetical protein [Puttea exsequens]
MNGTKDDERQSSPVIFAQGTFDGPAFSEISTDSSPDFEPLSGGMTRTTQLSPLTTDRHEGYFNAVPQPLAPNVLGVPQPQMSVLSGQIQDIEVAQQLLALSEQIAPILPQPTSCRFLEDKNNVELIQTLHDIRQLLASYGDWESIWYSLKGAEDITDNIAELQTEPAFSVSGLLQRALSYLRRDRCTDAAPLLHAIKLDFSTLTEQLKNHLEGGKIRCLLRNMQDNRIALQRLGPWKKLY